MAQVPTQLPYLTCGRESEPSSDVRGGCFTHLRGTNATPYSPYLVSSLPGYSVHVLRNSVLYCTGGPVGDSKSVLTPKPASLAACAKNQVTH